MPPVGRQAGPPEPPPAPQDDSRREDLGRPGAVADPISFLDRPNQGPHRHRRRSADGLDPLAALPEAVRITGRGSFGDQAGTCLLGCRQGPERGRAAGDAVRRPSLRHRWQPLLPCPHRPPVAHGRRSRPGPRGLRRADFWPPTHPGGRVARRGGRGRACPGPLPVGAAAHERLLADRRVSPEVVEPRRGRNNIPAASAATRTGRGERGETAPDPLQVAVGGPLDRGLRVRLAWVRANAIPDRVFPPPVGTVSSKKPRS